MTSLKNPLILMKNLSSLVEDIYKTLESCDSIDKESIKELSDNLTKVISDRLSQDSKRRDHLSLSSIGKPLRKLWYDLKEPKEDNVSPSNRLKFLYGDIIEVLVLWLAKVSGHTVTDCQREVNHHGIIGHIDSIIDGEVVDVKSASQRSFMKFFNGTLADTDNDPFGYLAQIGSYDSEVGKGHPGFLAVNKVTGEICLYQPDVDFDIPNTEELIKSCKEALSKDTPPEKRCYESIPDGKSGNLKLDKGCYYCPYKKKCWENLRAFKYSDGIRYLTTIVNEPKVEEIKDW